MGFPAFCSPFFSVKREILYFPYTCEWVFCFALLSLSLCEKDIPELFD